MVLGGSAFLPTQLGLALNAYKSLTNNKKPTVIVTVTNTLGAFVKLVYIGLHSYIKWKQNVYEGSFEEGCSRALHRYRTALPRGRKPHLMCGEQSLAGHSFSAHSSNYWLL